MTSSLLRLRRGEGGIGERGRKKKRGRGKSNGEGLKVEGEVEIVGLGGRKERRDGSWRSRRRRR